MIGYTPIITPIIINSSGGRGDGKSLLAMYIIVNIICITFFIVRSIIYLFNLTREYRMYDNYFEYVFGFGDTGITYLIFAFFSVINIMVVFATLAAFVSSFL